MPERRHCKRTPEQALGIAVRALREERRLTQKELSGKANLSVRTLKAIEEGRRVARWGTLRRVAQALGVPLPRLLTEAERRG